MTTLVFIIIMDTAIPKNEYEQDFDVDISSGMCVPQAPLNATAVNPTPLLVGDDNLLRDDEKSPVYSQITLEFRRKFNQEFGEASDDCSRLYVVEKYMNNFSYSAYHDCETLASLRRKASHLSSSLGYYNDVKSLSFLADLEATRALIMGRIFSPEVYLYTESGNLSSGPVDDSLIEENQNILDIAGEDVKMYDDGTTLNPLDNGKVNLSLDEFFARRVEIAAFNVALGATVSNSYEVWDLMTLDPAIRAKLRNYAYLKANMKIRVVISGSPFHYGRMLISYQPYAVRNSTLNSYALAPVGTRPLLLNYLSQSPQCAVMNIHANKPVEIVCPFISTKPMHRLFNSSAAVISDLTSYDDLSEAGRLYVYSLNSPSAVDASASPISIQIYGWFEDVELGMPTATQVAITTEASSRDDNEMKTGPVERFSSNAYSVTSKMHDIPYIGVYARASSYVLAGIKGVASLFGWSKPVLTDDAKYVKNRPFTNGAQLIGSETTKRITLDPLQEISIDPRVVSLDTDEMTIHSIASRESYLTTFTWSPADELLKNSIFKIRVHPQMDTIFRGVGKDFYQPTALSFASTPFEYWRGDIMFRFEVVCSQYHRGKLLVYYEPNIAQESLIDPDVSLNKDHIYIVDIQETQDFCLTVQWGAPRGWMRIMDAPNSILNYGAHFSASSNSYNYVNGYIGVMAFTDIQSPDDSAIPINVYVHSANMHYNQFLTDHMPLERLYTESTCISDCDTSPHILNPSSASTDWISQMHFGEEPLSYRSLLKRYANTRDEVTIAGSSSDRTYRATLQAVPIIRPSYGSSAVARQLNLLSYLRYAYLGLRGGVRKRVHLAGNSSFGSTLYRSTITMEEPGVSNSSSFSWSTDPCFVNSRGTVSFVPHTNGGIEAEIPMYTNNLFLFSYAADLVGSNSVGDMDDSWSKLYSAQFECEDPSSNGVYFVEETATGEDFQMLRFNGAPFFSSNPVV